jgi:two-component system chemotaxis sensor kinase CheA
MAQDPYRYFRLEARELLDKFGATILDLDKSDNGAPQVQRLLRLAHTLKGAARVVKQPEIADRAHAIEDVLSPFRETADSVPSDRVDVVLAHLDDINGRVLALTPAPPEGAVLAQPSRTAVDDSVRTVRAEIADMDALLDGVLETHALLNGLRATAGSIEPMQRLADLVAEQLAPRGRAGEVRHPQAVADNTYALADELRRSFAGLERKLGSAIDQMDRELPQLRDAAEQLRLVPAGTLFTPLERTARDTAQALGKQVVFAGKGGDIRLDADVLGTLQGALVQIVRNAVAHGIESETERRAKGKSAAGRVVIDISRRGNRIVFACRDDGRGLDLDAVRRVALQRGLDAAAVNRFGAEDLVQLLLRGGISTAAAVTEVSGRGIGLDVVREAVERLGGAVTVATGPGTGTVLELTVPLSLASMEALIVAVGGTAVTIPLDAVRGSMRRTTDEVSHNSVEPAVVYEHMAIPFLWLPRVLDGSRLPADRACTIVIVAASRGTVALGVERLLGAARIVVRPLPELAPASAIVAGASLDAEGNPQLVLDPDGLVAAAQGQGAGEPEPMPSVHPVLVVDDSLTTRMLEQSILESAGYEVDAAVSGEEALEIARRRRYALFLVDVEMPGMDGFTFVERTRSDPALRDIPAILVTSRSADEDRQRGRDAGAQGYIVKGDFDQTELLIMIRALIG